MPGAWEQWMGLHRQARGGPGKPGGLAARVLPLEQHPSTGGQAGLIRIHVRTCDVSP